MASRPGQRTDEDGKTIFPSATATEVDDVQGHVALVAPADEDDGEGDGPQGAG